MAKEVRIPELGENVEEAEVLSVLVSEGDEVKAEQPILELETDKATFEMPCPEAGVVKAIRVSAGDKVEIGQVVLELESAAEERDDGDDAAEDEDGGDEKVRGGGDRDRDEEERDAEPAEGEADASEREAASSEEEPAEEKASSEEGEEAEEPRPAADAGPPAPAAPSVRRFARELGVEIREVAGSGPEGRISAEDVKRHAREIIQSRPAPPGRQGRRPAPQLPDFSAFGEVEREPLSGIRRRTAENMTRSWIQIPHVAQHDRADVTELERARRALASRAKEAGTRLTLTAVVVKVAASALRVFPKFNASLDLERDEAILKSYVNIGVAVDTEHGLMAPVIRHADAKSLLEIAADLGELSERARRRKARPEDLKGSCFTVTNLGGLGTTTFAPLVQWPEVAVLGVGRIGEELRLSAGQPEARRVLPLSLSYDHRWIDGADAARFLRWVAEALENPLRLALGA